MTMNSNISKIKKKILVVDDSALMRRVLCDIIEQDKRFQVVEKATNGLEALELLKKNTYDAVVLDVNMPKMNGLELLKELQKNKISARVVMASTDTKEGAKTTLDALELGALDFVHKPDSALECRKDLFRNRLIQILTAVTESKTPSFTKAFSIEDAKTSKKMVELVSRHAGKVKGNKVVAIASSTGGPKALQSVVPRIPAKLNAPVVIVQHMPAGFTASLAERLNSLSEAEVKEAAEGDILLPGKVYISKGGKHLKIRNSGGRHMIYYSDEPTREGVKPCANYMYESLSECRYDEVVCVVLTGMGADGTKGISYLRNKKKTHVIAQDEDSCAVYGMPKSIVVSGLANQIVPLEQVAQEIIMNVGVI